MKKITVFINGTPKTVENRDYTLEEVAKLSGHKPHKGYTMSSTQKKGKNHQIYSMGDKIKMKEGMRLNIDLTINV